MSLNMNLSKNKCYELKYETILKRIIYERKYGFLGNEPKYDIQKALNL